MKKTRAIATLILLLLTCCSGDKPVYVGGKPCPDWSSNPLSNYSNEDFSNLGCATGNNNFVQLHNPADYSHGNSKGGISIVRDSNILQPYFNGASTASSSASSSSSTSSR